MTSRTAWLFAWIWLAFAVLTLLVGRLALGAVWFVAAGLSFWKALRGGGRPWHRDTSGRFPD
jgi:hypothetical protein